MSSEPMTRAALIEFVRENFDPEDIWDDIEMDSLHDDCYIGLPNALDAALGEGWINPQDPRTYDPYIVEQMVENLGLTLGARLATVEAYHDDNKHTGAVQWCTHPMCAGD